METTAGIIWHHTIINNIVDINDEQSESNNSTLRHSELNNNVNIGKR